LHFDRTISIGRVVLKPRAGHATQRHTLNFGSAWPWTDASGNVAAITEARNRRLRDELDLDGRGGVDLSADKNARARNGESPNACCVTGTWH
jgi:hypothetical protein